ncbi:thioesterase II family protein [Streptomyces sp. NPDC057302]|uniref:thioesterase II family protein n=1 Tax=Streptomyces sp. NPDC057302 TaxID=3346094 RepID=UPI003640CB80
MTSAAPQGTPGSSTVDAPYASWLCRLDTQPDATTRLICLPHAGGSASAYRSWLTDWHDAPELWAVQYPGREDRTEEALPGTLPELAQHIALALQWMADKPYTLFGHSMGALVAYETVRQAGQLGLPAPARLIASGSPPPDATAAQSAGQDDSPEVQWLQEGEEGPDPELRRTATRILTGDLALLASYAPKPQALDVPLVVLSNEDDPDVDDDTATDWDRFTAAELQHVTLPGDHFACYGQAGRILSALRDSGR